MNLVEQKNIFGSRIVQAEYFVKQNPLFYDASGMFWVWDQDLKYYKKTDEVDILNIFDRRYREDIANSKIRTEVVAALKQVGRLNVPQFSDKKLIQFKQGLCHVDCPGIILEPNPNYFITNPIPWEIGASDETPVMDYIFKQWVGEKFYKTLYEIIAYCMLPDIPIHRLFCFVGSGRNGKSSFLSLIRKFLGNHNVTTTDLDTLMNSRFEVARLHRKLVCEMGETNLQEMSKTQIIKKLTGGDLIGFEYKNKTPFEETCYAKLLISTNTLPPTADKSDGFYIRWIIVPFVNKFDEKIEVLNTIPEEEYRNLGLKCLRILQKLLIERHFSEEGDLDHKIKKYEELSNPVDKFFESYVELDGLGQIGKGEFRSKINGWLLEHRHRAISDISINRKMQSLGVEEVRLTLENGDKPRVWSGIKWKETNNSNDSKYSNRFEIVSHMEKKLEYHGKAGIAGLEGKDE